MIRKIAISLIAVIATAGPTMSASAFRGKAAHVETQRGGTVVGHRRFVYHPGGTIFAPRGFAYHRGRTVAGPRGGVRGRELVGHGVGREF
jgi:hypothetical protein